MKSNSSSLKKFLCFLMIFTLMFSSINFIPTASAASARSAEKVLTELISVKNQWAKTTNQRTRTSLTKKADQLRKELKQTKEYRKNVKVSSRNFLVKKGKEPGFRKVADTLCFAPYDTVSNVQAALKYIKAYNMSFWGDVCVITGGIIFTGTVIYAGVTYGSAVIAGAGMKIAKWKLAVSTAISTANAHRISHLLYGSTNSNHHWYYLFNNVTWNNVKMVVEKALLYGQNITIGGYPAKAYVYKGYTVIVKYYVSGSNSISLVDGWVLPK